MRITKKQLVAMIKEQMEELAPSKPITSIEELIKHLERRIRVERQGHSQKSIGMAEAYEDCLYMLNQVLENSDPPEDPNADRPFAGDW